MKGFFQPLLILPLLVAGVSLPTLSIFSPKAGSAWGQGRIYKIQWTKTGAMGAGVMLGLFSGEVKVADIAEQTANSGIFSWKIPKTLKPGPYRIRIETTDHAVKAESGIFQVVSPVEARLSASERPGLRLNISHEVLLNLPLLPPNLVKPDFSQMEFEFIESHIHSDMLPPWFILKFQAKTDHRYLKYVYRLRENNAYVDYWHIFKFKESPAAKEIVVEKDIIRPLKFSAPKYAMSTYRRDAYEKIIQLLTYRRYLVANGYFESAWDRVVDFFTDVGNLFDLMTTLTEAVFGDVDYARITKLAKNFYTDCIEIKNEDLYEKCTSLWYEINDLIIEHAEEVQFDYLDKTDGVYNRISKVYYIDLIHKVPLII